MKYLIVDEFNDKSAAVEGQTKQEIREQTIEIAFFEGMDISHINFIKMKDESKAKEL